MKAYSLAVGIPYSTFTMWRREIYAEFLDETKLQPKQRVVYEHGRKGTGALNITDKAREVENWMRRTFFDCCTLLLHFLNRYIHIIILKCHYR